MAFDFIQSANTTFLNILVLNLLRWKSATFNTVNTNLNILNVCVGPAVISASSYNWADMKLNPQVLCRIYDREIQNFCWTKKYKMLYILLLKSYFFPQKSRAKVRAKKSEQCLK